MMQYSMHEWGHLEIGNASGTLSRLAANRLVAAAHLAQKRLRVGGPDGEGILFEQGCALRARQVVGVIAARGVTLEITPKLEGLDDGATRRILVRMLARTIGLKIADGELTQLGVQHFDLLEILIRLFCNKLFASVHRGLPRRYVANVDDLRALRGRLNVNRQFTTLAASPQWLACQYEDLSIDIPLNQVLKFAVQRLRSISRATDNQRRLIELEAEFAEVATVPISALQRENIVLDRTNTDWHDLYHLAQLLLGNRFQNTSLGDDRGFSLLFDMNALFEKFVGFALRGSARNGDLSVTLQAPHGFALFEMTSDVGRFLTKPDIVIHREGRPVMIIDTKWKRLRGVVDDTQQGVSQADIYQMIAYGQVYGVKQLMLLYPHHAGLGTVGVQSTRRITGMPGSCLSVATVDLSNIETVPVQLAGLYNEQLVAEPHIAA